VNTIPKHEPSKKTKAKKTRLTLADMPHINPATEYAESDYRHSRCVEEALDGLTSVLSTWAMNERNGDNGSSLYSSPNGYPVKVQLSAGTDEEDCTVWIECEALDRLATAFERIADAMTTK
jgi:hypothetical protein